MTTSAVFQERGRWEPHGLIAAYGGGDAWVTCLRISSHNSQEMPSPNAMRGEWEGVSPSWLIE